MDFDDTPAEAAFRAQARAFLQAHAPHDRNGGTGRHTRACATEEMTARAREWQAVKAAHGFAALAWPRRWGGREASAIEQVIYLDEEARHDVPHGVYDVTVGMCIPTLLAYGSEAQLARHVPPALRGEEMWCQLFSEPGAGSDVAGLRTRARRDGDGWRVDGHKIWTSRAHLARFGLLIARTDPDVPKQAGLTAFFIDMQSPGVLVRPIQQASGDRSFGEVFLSDVRVPDSQRLGAVGGGWGVTLTALSHARLAVSNVFRPDVGDLRTLCTATSGANGRKLLADPAARRRLAELHVRTEGVRHTRKRVMTALSRGQAPGPEADVCKAVTPQLLQDSVDFVLDLLGAGGAVMDASLAPESGWLQQAFLDAPSKRVGGGTDEIVRNVIAERVLGLPGDMQADQDIPFSRIPTMAQR
ncbi:acyl-CoA dehydrogenase family protein [Pseudorhodoferax sp. Leaf267]|uniref:acyl-CoA dehydrogenase family protein n=1 Tax=Pseudorhodoferax sp. Leaf267 TaxID=1736316 RepID=UPI0006F678CA|nr:acyl-CoA dehydrogenase family protein [Pseudorhodoferax sp. Leaf267]KQP14184.1 hypothetical protein ASF43_15240 [Pseudorhodoferax sp. Leaf267]